MTGHNYLEFLQNELPEQLEDVPLATQIAMYFQHDGDPPHYSRLVMQHLDGTFPNRWIDRGSTITSSSTNNTSCISKVWYAYSMRTHLESLQDSIFSLLFTVWSRHWKVLVIIPLSI
jgi:hypothetical protein